MSFSDPFIDRLEAELAALEADLQRDGRYRKMMVLREALAVYQHEAMGRRKRRNMAFAGGSFLGSTFLHPSSPPSKTVEASVNEACRAVDVVDAEVIPGYKMVPKTKEELVRDETLKFLKWIRNSIVHRTEVARHLVDLKILDGVKDPVNSLSAYLTKWPDLFKSDGRGHIVLLEAKNHSAEPTSSAE